MNSQTRDNGVVAIVAGALVSQRKITAGVERATARAPVRRCYCVSATTSLPTGSETLPWNLPAIILTDKASKPENLREVAQRVSLKLMDEAKTDESGLQAYFSFRSRSEQAKLKEPAWA